MKKKILKGKVITPFRSRGEYGEEIENVYKLKWMKNKQEWEPTADPKGVWGYHDCTFGWFADNTIQVSETWIEEQEV